MNSKSLIAAAALALIGSAAMAQTNYTEEAMFRADPTSSVSRADVRAEFLRAQAANDLPVNSDVAPVMVAKAPAGALTRSQARAAYEQQPLDLTLAVKVDPAAGRSRQDVRAEAVAFTKSGQSARVQAGY
jgi:hypothetical protein